MDKILQKLNEYFNEFLLLLPRLGLAILILVIGILLAGFISGLLRKTIRKKSQDPLMSKFLSKAAKILLVIVVFMLALSVAGLSGIAAAILATAGASAVIIGFAFKDIAENFLAGVILAFNRPFNVNDTVQIEDVFGKIISMEFRYTKITTFDGRNVYIPNADVLTKPVFNFTEDNFYRTDFVVGIAYEDDVEKAKEIVQKVLDEDEDLVHDDTHVNFVIEYELAASTLNLKVFLWINTEDFRRHMLVTKGNVMREVKTALEQAGFNLPADITEIKFYDASNPIRFDSQIAKIK